MRKQALMTAVTVLAIVLMVSDAFAIAGVRRRTRRRTAVVVGSSVHAADEASAQQQQAAAKQPAPAATPAPAPATPAPASATPAPASAPAGKPLALGAVVSVLPASCPSTVVSGVTYYTCGGNYYRAVFEGSSLVYVTVAPPT